MQTISNFTVLAMATALVACSGGGGGLDPPATVTVASIALNPTAPRLAIGESLTMTAVAHNASGGVVSGVSFSWSSRNTGVATIDATGRIRGIAAGNTEVVAAHGTIRQTASVTVVEPSTGGAVSVVDLDPTHAAINEGDSVPFTAIPKDNAGEPLGGRGIAWSVLDPSIASVDPGGSVTALRPGMTNVSARVDGITGTASVRIEAGHRYGLLLGTNDAPGVSTIRSINISDPAGVLITIPLPGEVIGEPSPSPDGQRLAYVARTINETAIFVANRDGSNVRRITQMLGSFDQPAWSPDGTRIAFRGRLAGFDSDIWVIDIDGTNARNLTIDQGPTHQSSPAWSPLLPPNTYRIAYTHTVGGLGQLYTMRDDGSLKQSLTASGVYHDDQPSWSPDGTTLVFQRSGNAVFGDLFLLTLATGNTRSLTAIAGPIAGIQLNPSWSPDGRMIAFASNHDGGLYQIYTLWADGTRLARRTFETVELFAPKWVTY